ncbi:TolC family protein [Granulicella tundricola]|uniref:Outer membrane efflux protein n=1 Tax=Granulicella tundricola (strain ATCC BAA-1859 / DSM 23138 / MP5ACTX9) TaxID=1198114 RepID=E8WY90_GRATM|nr:outer membrane efflux protein [Granulicella tundricola MP5ACTX9]
MNFERTSSSLLLSALLLTQTSALVAQQAAQVLPAAPTVSLDIPHSHNPIETYRAAHVPAPDLANSARIDTLVHDGVLELSLRDAIALALENNLDLAIARYNIPIAKADVLRTKAGGTFLGVNTGVVQNTPGGGFGGFGSGSNGAGAGGTSGGAGGAGAGASGLVQSTLGTGSLVSSYDPNVSGTISYQNSTTPLSSEVIYGVPTLHQGDFSGTVNYTQAFATGTSIAVGFNSDRLTSNSPFTSLTPELDGSFQALVRQHLLSGFGLGPNLRYLRIARNNQKISDQAFELQVVSTVTQIANIYWDLVAAYEDEQVKSHSLDFARQTLDKGHKQLDLQAIPALDVLKDEAEVANREQDLTIARSQLQFQSLLIKNALTKNLDDPILEAMPVRPTDLATVDLKAAPAPAAATDDLVEQALNRRIEINESNIDLQNRKISRDALRNSLLPQVDLVGYYGGTGLGGVDNPLTNTPSTAPGGYGGTFKNTFNNSAPNYYVGVNVNVPIRNRVAKSDQVRSELESRQAEVRLQQQRKQIRIEVRNAQYSLDQSLARVTSAMKARDLSERLFTISGKEQELGAGSALQTLAARRDLATAESALVAALTAYQKAKVELDRATGQTLTANTISIESARSGTQPASTTTKP